MVKQLYFLQMNQYCKRGLQIRANGVKMNLGQINSQWNFDDYIWEIYNKPWLEGALQRGDEIVIWSDPIVSRTGFYKRELDFIQLKAHQYGYDYNLGINIGTFTK